MKFSITFKYSNVTFKNKETKETVTFDSKAETGNTFTFDNVDEDVVIGIVKGLKEKKASQVFSYDNLRTNFINVIARNKCKELYDKLDKGEWKIEDIAISTVTIKDLEFTKPTMNARENLTVESRKVNESEKKPVIDKLYKVRENVNEAAAALSWAAWDLNKIREVDVRGIQDKIMEEHDAVSMSRNSIDTLIDDISSGKAKVIESRKKVSESKEEVEVEFKKTPEDDGSSVIAFFPQTMHDGSCNPGNIMSYEHSGQHGEASIDFYHDCTNCLEEDYASLLHELERIYDDCELVVV